MRPRLLALDLDGTVLTEDCRIPAGHARAIRAIEALGLTVAIVTGRSLLTTRVVWNDLGLATPLVCFNGAWVGRADRTVLAASLLAEDDVRAVVEALAGVDGSLSFYPDADRWIMDRELPATAGWRALYRAPIEVDAAVGRTWRGTSCKLMFVADPQRIPAVVGDLRARFGDRFHLAVSQPDRFEIHHRGITKAWGLARLAAHLGIAREAVWAVGDADNDREMIAWAGTGCAMGHAPDGVLALARHRLPGIEARGLCALVPMIERACGAGR
jgi:Cof subfamily protein (haloacid dehalogenase superfamily)